MTALVVFLYILGGFITLFISGVVFYEKDLRKDSAQTLFLFLFWPLTVLVMLILVGVDVLTQVRILGCRFGDWLLNTDSKRKNK